MFDLMENIFRIDILEILLKSNTSKHVRIQSFI